MQGARVSIWLNQQRSGVPGDIFQWRNGTLFVSMVLASWTTLITLNGWLVVTWWLINGNRQSDGEFMVHDVFFQGQLMVSNFNNGHWLTFTLRVTTSIDEPSAIVLLMNSKYGGSPKKDFLSQILHAPLPGRNNHSGVVVFGVAFLYEQWNHVEMICFATTI